MKKRLFVLMMAAGVLMAGCGAKEEEASVDEVVESVDLNPAGAENSTDAVQADDKAEAAGETADAPDYEGTYYESIAGRGNITFTKSDAGSYTVEIRWSSSYAEMAAWDLTATAVQDGSLVYADCVRSTITFDEAGNDSSVIEYENGTGKFYLEDGALHWIDDVDHAGDDSLFYRDDMMPEAYGEDVTSDDTGYYSGVTTMDSGIVEAFAENVKQAYLDGDWETIAVLINYPITMYPDKVINSEEEFLAYVNGKTVSESDRAEMENETCKDMFYNGQGICMGSGQIWFIDKSYMTDEEQLLKIIAVSGLE